MQSLKTNIKNGLVTLGVVVAVIAVLLTPGFLNPPKISLSQAFEVENKEVVTTTGVKDAVEQTASAVFGLVRKTSLQ